MKKLKPSKAYLRPTASKRHKLNCISSIKLSPLIMKTSSKKKNHKTRCKKLLKECQAHGSHRAGMEVQSYAVNTVT
jgi:hypothetical protein